MDSFGFETISFNGFGVTNVHSHFIIAVYGYVVYEHFAVLLLSQIESGDFVMFNDAWSQLGHSASYKTSILASQLSTIIISITN